MMRISASSLKRKIRGRVQITRLKAKTEKISADIQSIDSEYQSNLNELSTIKLP